MSLHSTPRGEVPAATAAVARATFPRGNRCLDLRDALGPIFEDRQFAELFAGSFRILGAGGGDARRHGCRHLGAHSFPELEDAVPTKSLSPLLPGELIVERTRLDADRLIVEARTKARVAACPRCERLSRRIHSH